MSRALICCLFLSAAIPAHAQAPGVADPRVVKTYHLGDLAGTTAPGPDLRLRTDHDDLAGRPPSTPPMVIAQLVRSFVQPPLLPNEEVQPIGERWLTLLGRPEQHAWLERFLATAHAGQEQLVAMECRFWAMPEATYQLDVAPALGEQGRALLEPGEGTAAFLQGLQKLAKVTQIAAPKLTVRPLTEASMSVENQTSYIRDFKVEKVRDELIADPVVAIVHDGLRLRTAATLLTDDTAGIALEAQIADLQKPIPTFETTLGIGKPISIQLPTVLTTRLDAAATVRSGTTAVFAMPVMAGQRHLLTVTVSFAKK